MGRLSGSARSAKSCEPEGPQDLTGRLCHSRSAGVKLGTAADQGQRLVMPRTARTHFIMSERPLFVEPRHGVPGWRAFSWNIAEVACSARGPSVPTRHTPRLLDPLVHLRSLRLL